MNHNIYCLLPCDVLSQLDGIRRVKFDIECKVPGTS